MKKICLVYGGNSIENEISILTGLKIAKELEKYSYPYMLVYLDFDGNFYCGPALLKRENYKEKKKFIRGTFINNQGSYYFKYGIRKEQFDNVILLVHGKGAEDGTIGGYFETLRIPVIYPGLNESSLLQHKGFFKDVMNSIEIPQTKYVRMNENQIEDGYIEKIKDLTFPLIIKPSQLGSSIGITKVKNEKELDSAIREALKYDDEIIIEECLEKFKEINIAIVKNGEKLVISELERVNNQNKVLTFYDKYDNFRLTDSHIIPADIDTKIKKKIINIAKKVYYNLNLKFVIRFDFLYDIQNGAVYLNELNSIPGSLAYYLFEPIGINIIDLIQILEDNFRIEEENKRCKITKLNNLSLMNLKDK